jgi:hypothetical protein
MPLDSHELPDGRTVKLGRPEPSPESPKDLSLAKFLRAPAELPKPPDVIDNTTVVHQPWPMLSNDRYGDCVFASTGHRRITQAAMLGKTVSVTDKATLQAYSAVTGFRVDDPSTDNGAVMVDAANWERKHTLSGDRIFAFARLQIDPNDDELVALATYYFGGIWLGVALPKSAQRQVGQVWDAADGPDSQPGSWGGHAIWVPKRNPDESECITWAARQCMTSAFVRKYAAREAGGEAWVVLPGAWHRRDPFDAIDWQALDAAVARFGPVDPAA